ncbi:hypothetical protein GCM10011488_27520 [Steroidobacter agaridevorans]|nr:hypothetical protein GCM10011488_27520 [Steroidobacter agaridevorans]
MSEGPTRRRTGATFADVWPNARTPTKSTSTDAPQPDATAGRESPPTQTSARTEPAAPSRPGATERTIAPRDHRISTETMEGKLLGHGTARYRFQPTEAPSYYARLLTSGGVVTLWGRGLAKAIAQSATHVRIGDRAAFRRLDQDPQTGRVQWRAEKPEWFAAQDKSARRRRDEQLAAQRAAKEDPELARAMLPMKAARVLAERRLSDPKQRLQFIAGVAMRLKQTALTVHAQADTPVHSQTRGGTQSDGPSGHEGRSDDRTR